MFFKRSLATVTASLLLVVGFASGAPLASTETCVGAPDDCKVWSDGCNICACDTGLCSDRECAQYGTPECLDTTCPSGCMTWFDGCNTFWCDTTGKVLSQTDFSSECKYNQSPPKCLDTTCPSGCMTWFDGCNTFWCDTTGKVLSQTDFSSGCKYNSKPAKCKKHACPATCTTWSDGCNDFKCWETGMIGPQLTDNNCAKIKNAKCVEYNKWCNNVGWTQNKMIWCCKKNDKDNRCRCDGQSGYITGMCDKNKECKGAGNTCQTKKFRKKYLNVCCSK